MGQRRETDIKEAEGPLRSLPPQRHLMSVTGKEQVSDSKHVSRKTVMEEAASCSCLQLLTLTLYTLCSPQLLQYQCILLGARPCVRPE